MRFYKFFGALGFQTEGFMLFSELVTSARCREVLSQWIDPFSSGFSEHSVFLKWQLSPVPEARLHLSWSQRAPQPCPPAPSNTFWQSNWDRQWPYLSVSCSRKHSEVRVVHHIQPESRAWHRSPVHGIRAERQQCCWSGAAFFRNIRYYLSRVGVQ